MDHEEIAEAAVSEVFSRKGDLKICSKFTGKHPCQKVISIELLRNFIQIAVNFLNIFKTS